MRKILLYILLISVSIGCKSNAQERTLNASVLMDKYNFKYLESSKISAELKQELFIPFSENGKYHISNYDGKRISTQEFDEIILFYFAPYYMGKIGGEYFLYSFLDKKVIPRSFNKTLNINNFHREDAKVYNNKLVVDGEEILLPKPYIEPPQWIIPREKKQTCKS